MVTNVEFEATTSGEFPNIRVRVPAPDQFYGANAVLGSIPTRSTKRGGWRENATVTGFAVPPGSIPGCSTNFMLTEQQIKTLAEADGWTEIYFRNDTGRGTPPNGQGWEYLPGYGYSFNAIIRLLQNLGIKTEIGLETTPEELAVDTVNQIEKRRSVKGT